MLGSGRRPLTATAGSGRLPLHVAAPPKRATAISGKHPLRGARGGRPTLTATMDRSAVKARSLPAAAPARASLWTPSPPPPPPRRIYRRHVLSADRSSGCRRVLPATNLQSLRGEGGPQRSRRLAWASRRRRRARRRSRRSLHPSPWRRRRRRRARRRAAAPTRRRPRSPGLPAFNAAAREHARDAAAGRDHLDRPATEGGEPDAGVAKGGSDGRTVQGGASPRDMLVDMVEEQAAKDRKHRRR